MSINRRSLLQSLAALAIAPTFPVPFVNNVKAQTGIPYIDAVVAIAQAYALIRDIEIKQATASQIASIDDRLGRIEIELNLVRLAIGRLPPIIQNLLVRQYQSEQVMETRAIGGSIQEQFESRSSSTLLNSIDELAKAKFLFAQFGLFSSPWIAEAFAYQYLAMRLLPYRRARSVFESAKRTTVALIGQNIDGLGREIGRHNAIVAKDEVFCQAHSSAFLGYTPVSGIGGAPSHVINYYSLVPSCPAPTLYDFQPRGEAVINARGVLNSPLFPSAAKSPVIGNPDDVLKERLNSELGSRFYPAQESRSLLVELKHALDASQKILAAVQISRL